MYSAVLMLALTAGNDAVEHGRNGCHGCTTVCSKTVASCSSACSSKCQARPGLFNRSHGCKSCTKACSTSCSTSTACSSRGHGLFGRRTCCSAPAACKSSAPAPAKELPKKSAAIDAPATIVVSLPADARLIVDGVATSSTSDRRTLVTPALEFGATYVYTMQAEVVVDGRTVAQTQQVSVRGGQVSTVNFNFSTQTVASR